MTTNSPTSSTGILPPPYTYEKAYSSYKVEWEEHFRQQSLDDVDVTDVTWLKYGQMDDDNARSITSDNDNNKANQMQNYLLGCTSLGEIIVWKVPTWSRQIQDTYQANSKTDRHVTGDDVRRPHHHTKPIFRMRLPALASSTTSSSNTSSPHRKYKIVVVKTSPPRKSNQSTNVSRKRNQASSVEDGLGNIVINNSTSLQGVFFIASEDGLWRIPLATLFSTKGERNDENTDMNRDVSNKKVVKRLIANRSISNIQVFEEYRHQQHQQHQQHSVPKVPFLYALEKDCITKWNVAMDDDDDDGGDNLPMATYPLSPWLNSTNQRPPGPMVQEKATTMLVVSNPNSSSSGSDPIVLVGTNNGRVLIVPTQPDNDPSSTSSSSTPQSISVIEKKDTTAFTPRLSSTPICWTVTSVMETHNTWWTVAVVASSTSSSSTSSADIASAISTIAGKRPTRPGGGQKLPTANTPSGFLSTWHAPTRAFIAICPTHESVHTIIQAAVVPPSTMNNDDVFTKNTKDDDIVPPTTADTVDTAPSNAYPSTATTSSFYSVANESVVSIWKSPYQLDRIGRVWISPPSGKAMAVCTLGDSSNSNNTTSTLSTDDNNNNVGCLVAIAGIGSRVDIVLDRCCIATMQLH